MSYRARQVRLTIPSRDREPSVVAMLGTTGSGKTHGAIERLMDARRGVYACPLRLLAHEAYATLRAQAPAGRVGLVTGEERIHPDAPILCTTTEMAPLSTDLLVLDELQWCADAERGSRWTRLLLGASVSELIVIGPESALPILDALDAEVRVRRHQRLVPLDVVEPLPAHRLPDRTLAIHFSRREVLEAATEHGGGVLYGRLPLRTRMRQMHEWRRGAQGVLWTTDVVGHGLNLPADNVVFCSLDKYDGDRMRPLLPWEINQIAGRAGRYGLSDRGAVTVDRPLAGRLAEVADALLAPLPAVRTLRLRPELADLGGAGVEDLPAALDVWHQLAQRAPEVLPGGWPEDLRHVRANLEPASLLSDDVEDVWRLSQTPVSPTHPEWDVLWQGLARWARREQWQPWAQAPTGLRAAEEAAALATGLLWIARRTQQDDLHLRIPVEVDLLARWEARADAACSRWLARTLKG